MGALLSLNSSRPTELFQVSQSESCKRHKMSSSFWDEKPRLIPSLPDEISLEILARLPRVCFLKMKAVSRSWKAAIISPEIYKVRKELGTTEEWLYILTKNPGDKLFWYALDPLSRKWQTLPPMPNLPAEDECKRGISGLRMWNMVGSSIRIADAIGGWLGKKNALDQNPFCGCAIGAVNGCLYVLGGLAKASAMSRVWKYDPILNSWSQVNSMSVGRAYCKTGVLNNKLFVVGGVSRASGGVTPLQSAEAFDPQTGLWSEIPSMPFSKAQVLPTAFLADMLRPIATGMTSYRGKLYVPQSLYCWPFFVDVGGEVYDPKTNAWVDMPKGMGEGWPAKQAGTKLSVVVDGDLYALDPSSSLDSAKIKVYDHQDDSWKVVEGDIPICDFSESESPCLLANFLGKLHVITKDANHNIAVMQADKQNDSSSSPSTFGEGTSKLVARSDPNIWRGIASRNSGSTELVSCQVLNV